MGTREIRKSVRTNKMKKNRRKRNLIILASFMAVFGLLLSKGSIGQFFKVLAIETAFVLVLFCLLRAYQSKNRKKSKTVTRNKAPEASYDRVDANRAVKRNQDLDLNRPQPRKNNYNWVIDESIAQESDNHESNSLPNRKLVYAGKIMRSTDRADSAEDDIKARVASWVEAVDYSGDVFRRIIESRFKSEEESEEESDNTVSCDIENIELEKPFQDGAEEKVDAENLGTEEEVEYWKAETEEPHRITKSEYMDEYRQFEASQRIEGIFEVDQIQEFEDMRPVATAEEAEVREEFAADIKNIQYMKEITEDKRSVEGLIEYEVRDEEVEDSIIDAEGFIEFEGIDVDVEDIREVIEYDVRDKEVEDNVEAVEEFIGFEDIDEDVVDVYETEGIHHIGDEDKTAQRNEAEEIGKVGQTRYPRQTIEPVFPPIELLKQIDNKNVPDDTGFNSETRARKLIDTLESFGVGARIINISEGPAVTRYELQPDYGVKVSKIVSLTDDIALNLAAVGVRIEAPIPGKAAIGIEIPNTKVTPVWLRDVIESEEFRNHPSKLAFAVGKDIAGKPVVADIAAMPHLLIAGATGSGKSVCINTLITSILYKASPHDVRLLMVDPKVVELSIYNGIPHLLIPVVTDPKKAAGALNWAVQEMTNRYKLFAENNVRDLKGYNHLMRREGSETLPQIVIIIDELADLMMVAPNDVEDCICRLAQMARAAGMHLVIATQRPSVNVITGVIKANIPSRISFAVSSQVDSRTILDMSGAEKLLGKGDMLFYPLGMPKPVRIQGALITDTEVENIVSFIKSTQQAQYDDEIIDKIDSHTDDTQPISEGDDELLPQVIDMIIEQEQASTSLIQRKFKIGYSRAARIIDQLEANGMVGPFEGSKPRKVLITKQQWQEMS